MKQCIPVPIFRPAPLCKSVAVLAALAGRCVAAALRHGPVGCGEKMGASKKELAWFTTPIPRVYGTYFLVILTYSNYN